MNPYAKTNVFLPASFLRHVFDGSPLFDQLSMLFFVRKLVQVIVGILFLSMEVNQCITQGIWNRDSMLL